MRIITNHFKKAILQIAFLFLCISGLAQSTMGTDFWVTFLPSPDVYGMELSLIAAGPRPCSGTITNSNTNWSTSFSVSPGTTTKVVIPASEAYSETSSDVVLNTGIHVSSTDTISLYASNFQEYSFDITNVLPTESLGSEYIIQSYPPTSKDAIFLAPNNRNISGSGDHSEFTIVAVEDNTQVSILLVNNSANGHYANQPFTVTLNEGQCYQIQAETHNDLSGSLVTVADDKKVAVFSGNYCVNIPTDTYCCCDHIVEQMMPITCWGQHFVITSSMLRTNDIICITSLNDNCQIKIDGVLLTTINAKQTYQHTIYSNHPSTYIETSEPSMVYLYYTGSQCGGSNGDPSMVIINPIEQKIKNVTFSTFNSGASQYHYVNVVTDSDKVSSMYLDGNSIESYFNIVSGNTDYSFARININHGSHTLSCLNGGFVAHVYGLGKDESYAYSVGAMAMDLTSQLLVDGLYVNDNPNGFAFCGSEVINFDLNLNYHPSRVSWDFGDGTSGGGFPVSHEYDRIGSYQVICDIYKIDNDQEVLVSTLNTTIQVNATYETYLYATSCEQYDWFEQTYNKSGIYTYPLQSSHGCDSLLILDLTIKHGYNDTIYETACDSLPWTLEPNGYLYESGLYTYHEKCSNDCDSIINLNLIVNKTPDLVIHGETQLAISSDLWPGIYRFCIADSLELNNCSITWSCSNPDWIFLPETEPYWCKLLVSTLGNANLKAVTHCNTGCDAEYSLHLYSWYYDIDEIEKQPVFIYPNPVQKSLNIKTHQLTNIKMFNCFGQIVYKNNYDKLDSANLDVENMPGGIYYLEITTTTGRIIKKVLLSKGF